MNQNRLLKERVTELRSQLEAERAWWDKKRAGISSNFMKELEEDGKAEAPAHLQKKTGSDDDAVLVEAGGPANVQGSMKKKNKAKK